MRIYFESEAVELLEGFLPAGPHSLVWDGRGADGRRPSDSILTT